MRVAVIGGGISGLSAAWLLNEHHDLVLYEAEDRLGGHSHTIDAPLSTGTIPVDTGFLVYNEKTYPNLIALFNHFDVPTRASDMSFGVSIDRGRIEYAGSETISALFAQKRNVLRPQFQRMLIDVVRFNKVARRLLGEEKGSGEETIDDFLGRCRFGEGFIHHYFLPMCAAIWSSPLDHIRSFPARSLLRFFENHGLLNIYTRPRWRTVVGGSRTYVDKLSAPFRDRVRTASAAKHVARIGEEILVVDARGRSQHFDTVVFACHADQTLRLMDRTTRAEREILSGFRYQKNRAVLHTDPRLMPVRRKAWSSWNYLSERGSSGQAAVSVTYWLNRLQGFESPEPVLVSLNPPFAPDATKVIADLSYDHPQFDHAALAAQARLSEIQGVDRVWFAGAYWGYGFHEDGLLSGLRVAAGLGVTPPWWSNVTVARPALPSLQPAAREPRLVAVGGN